MNVLQYVRPFATMMFTDTMNIYRHVSTVSDYGATVVDVPDTPTYENVPCRLSWSELESPRSPHQDYTEIEVPIKIFCAYDQDIKAGDYVEVTRYSGDEVIGVYKGICADFSAYESHKELYFRVQEPA